MFYLVTFLGHARPATFPRDSCAPLTSSPFLLPAALGATTAPAGSPPGQRGRVRRPRREAAAGGAGGVGRRLHVRFGEGQPPARAAAADGVQVLPVPGEALLRVQLLRLLPGPGDAGIRSLLVRYTTTYDTSYGVLCLLKRVHRAPQVAPHAADLPPGALLGVELHLEELLNGAIGGGPACTRNVI